MTKIQDSRQIERLKLAHPVGRYFSRAECPYHYRVYEKNELMQRPDSSGHNLYILLSGQVSIYSISAAGQKEPIATVGTDQTVGELELSGQYVPFYAEVARRVECLTLSIGDCRRYLMDDPVFLRFLVNILAEKLTFGSNIDHSMEDMNERVLYYFRSRPDHQIDHVEEATYGLRCSRSSLQRSLGQLCREGKIEKLGKGAYRLK